LLPKEALELDDFYFDFFDDFLCFVRRGARVAFVLLPPYLRWCVLLRGCHSVSGVGDVAEIFFPESVYDGGEVADCEENLLSQQCVPYRVDRRVLVGSRSDVLGYGAVLGEFDDRACMSEMGVGVLLGMKGTAESLQQRRSVPGGATRARRWSDRKFRAFDYKRSLHGGVVTFILL